MDHTKERILAAYQLTPADYLAQGMEAEVYRYGTDAVLKLYAGHAALDNLRRLQHFYTTLDRTALSYGVPRIERLVDEGDYLVTIEPRLVGQPLQELIAKTAPADLDGLFPRYLAAVLELGRLTMPSAATHYKLFDPTDLSLRTAGDWHQFLLHWLQAQLQTLAPYFARDVLDFPHKLQRMEQLLAAPYTGPYALVHGDIFPGNLLVDAQGQVQALLDFGLFTMYGDPLFDVATAWVFFDMYDELRANVRARLLMVILDHLGEDVRGKLYRYVLLFSLLAANTYAPDRTDGHYQWSVANLNNEAYWRDLC
ncbi:MAG: aminoglycoside phosphotransferase family protein [Caldilineaceae bacterium]